MSNFITSWILDLVDNVSAPLQAVQGAADVTADAVNKVRDANKGVESSANAASVATTASGKAAGFASGMFNTLKSAILPLIGISAVIGLVTNSLKDFDDQARANNQMLATLESTNHAAGRSFEELESQASKLRDLTLFSDDDIMGAQSLLLTFKNVSGEVYDTAVPAVLDLATAMQTDLKSASVMMGKALNDPAQGLTALRRVGIQFNDSQEATIKKLVETGRTAEAQKIILAELATQFGDSAQAAAEAGTNKFTEPLKDAWSEIREMIGELASIVIEVLAPPVVKVLGWLTSLFTFLIEHKDVIFNIANAALAGAAAFGIFKIATFLLSGGLGIMATTAVTAAHTMTAAIISIPIIGWIAAAIAALVALGTYFWNTSAEFRGFLTGLWEAVKVVFTNILGFIGDTLSAIDNMILNVFNPKNWFNSDYSITDDLNKIGDIAKKYGETIGKAFKDGQQKGLDSFAADKEKKESAKAGKVGGVLPVLDGYLNDDPSKKGEDRGNGEKQNKSQKGLSLSGDGSSGGGRSITMNVNMTNNFNGRGNDEAMKIVRQINDRLSDAAAAI